MLNLKILISISLLWSLAVSSETASTKTKDSHSETKTKKEGFYFYQDPQNNQKVKKVPVTPPQKLQADLTQELIKEMRENNRLQRKILKKLEYAFPRTIPEYTTNKKTGKPCKTNSSADCFVMPVVKEAQNSVPVMAKMIKNPTEKNIKNYLEWQGTYLNQAFKIGSGFSLVNKQYGRELTKLDGMSETQMPLSGSKQNEIGYFQKSATIRKLNDKLGLLVFVGHSREHERNMDGKKYISVLNSSFKDMKNLKYVYMNKKDKIWVENKIKQNIYDKDAEKYSKVSSVVSPDYFKQFNINVTPASVVIYRKDDGTMIWQKLGYTMEARPMLDTIYSFLKFHNIVKPGAVNEKNNWMNADRLRNGKSFSRDFINSIDINESSIKVPKDQIITKKRK